FKPSKLFHKLCGPRVITLKPLGFPLSTNSTVNFREFRFTVDTNADFAEGEYSSLDVKKWGLAFEVAYDPEGKEDPIQALDSGAWSAIQPGPFLGRQFMVWPRELSALYALLDDESMDAIPVSFSHTGSAIAGLYFSQTMKAASWDFFVDKRSREGKILELARQL
ncbi:MAG: hypothetical protein ACYCZ0_04800, partial [Minisyncoccota bacterium]